MNVHISLCTHVHVYMYMCTYIIRTIEVERIEHYASIRELLRSIIAKFSQQNSLHVHVEVPKYFFGYGVVILKHQWHFETKVIKFSRQHILLY